MSHTPRQRLMSLATDLLLEVESHVTELVQEPGLKISHEELEGFTLAYSQVVRLVQAAYPKASLESSIGNHYWPDQDMSESTGERMNKRLRSTAHGLGILERLYGSQAG